MNYKNKELDIFIENADYFEIKEFVNDVQLNVNKKIMYSIYRNSFIRAHSESYIESYGNSIVTSYDGSRVLSHDKSFITAREKSTVEAFDKSTVEAYDISGVVACNSSFVTAHGCSGISAHDKTRVLSYDNSIIYAYKKSNVEAYDNSRVIAYHNSRVKAYHNSCVKSYDNSHILASGFSVVYVRGKNPVVTDNHYGTIIPQVFKVKKRMTVYKKLDGGLIAELELKKGQTFQSANHARCRTDSAKVLRIIGNNGEEFQEGFVHDDNKLAYRVGEIVNSEYNPDIEKYSSGIHFFLDRKTAKNY